MPPIHERVSPGAVLNVFVWPALRAMALNVTNNFRHMIPLLIAEIGLIRALDCNDTLT